MAEEKDDNQIELDVGDAEETEVELEVEQPEESPIEVAASDEDDNFEKASNATQKRIDRLTKKMRTAEREREEAIRYAQQVQTEAEDLKKP